jgi:site-specific DNA recombinase
MSESHSTTRFRGVVYGRKSKQDTDEGGSISQQMEWAKPTCARERIDVVASFSDDGVSGHATGKRADFHRMLTFCQEAHRRHEPIDVIVCWHANRFSRADSQETGWYLWEFRKVGVSRMLTSQRWIDFERMEDRVLLGIEQDVSSHKYSIDLAEASTRGKIKRAKAGRWCGGRVPYGYRLLFREVPGKPGKQEPDRLVPDPETAAVVRWLFTTYAGGQISLRMLAAQLNARGEPTPSARLGGKRTAARWTVPTIRGILTNEVYLGRLVWNKSHQGRFLGVVNMEIEAKPNRVRRTTTRNADAELIRSEGKHDALTDQQTFELCRRRLAEQRRNTTPKSNRYGEPTQAGDLLLRGLVRCGHCDRPMVGRHKERGTGGGGVPVYLCGSYLQHGKSVCNYNCLPEAPLLSALVRKLADSFTPKFLAECRTAFLKEASAESSQANEESLNRRLAELEGQLARAARRMLTEEDEGLIATLRDQAKKIKADRDRVAGELAALKRASQDQADPGAVVDLAMELLGRLDEALKDATPAEVRAILNDHIERVELWFAHEQVRHETHCTFARGLIWLREDSPLAACLSTSPGTSSGTATASTTTAGTPTPGISRS